MTSRPLLANIGRKAGYRKACSQGPWQGPRRIASIIRARPDEIAADACAAQRNVTAIKGATDTIRLRTGGWRTIYEVDREADVVRVLAIKPRGKVYR